MLIDITRKKPDQELYRDVIKEFYAKKLINMHDEGLLELEMNAHRKTVRLARMRTAWL